jgi:hypothetical protein
VVPDFDSPVGVVIGGASQVALDAAWHGRDAKAELLKNPSLTQRDIDFICKILRQAADDQPPRSLSRLGFLRRGRGAPGIHHRPQRAV